MPAICTNVALIWFVGAVAKSNEAASHWRRYAEESESARPAEADDLATRTATQTGRPQVDR
jgi:hypothetical protein